MCNSAFNINVFSKLVIYEIIVVMSNWKLYIAIAIILILSGITIGYLIKPDVIVTKTEVKIRIDTNNILLPIYTAIEKIVPKWNKIIINRTDTIFKSFLATIDTTKMPCLIDSTNLYLTTEFTATLIDTSIVTKDTHTIVYYFPNNHFVFTERPGLRKEITINKDSIIYIDTKKQWYEEEWFIWSTRAISFIGGLYIGLQVNKK